MCEAVLLCVSVVCVFPRVSATPEKHEEESGTGVCVNPRAFCGHRISEDVAHAAAGPPAGSRGLNEALQERVAEHFAVGRHVHRAKEIECKDAARAHHAWASAWAGSPPKISCLRT